MSTNTTPNKEYVGKEPNVVPTNVFIQVVNQEGHTEVLRWDVFVAALIKPMVKPMMKAHAAMGVCGEAGELCDAIKKDCIYGKEPNIANIVEELGDIEFYCQVVRMLYGISHQEVFQANVNKLAVRYKGMTYSDAAADLRADKNGNIS